MSYIIDLLYSKILKGADFSWQPQMEATGYRFYNRIPCSVCNKFSIR